MLLFRDPPNFSMAEFTRSDTARELKIDNSVPENLIPNAYKTLWMLQEIRNYIQKVKGRAYAIKITSGFRCEKLNGHPAIGGSKTSRHMQALAVDFVVPGLSVQEVFDIIRSMPDRRYHKLINEFGTWIHLSMCNEIPLRQDLIAVRRNGKVKYEVFQ